MTFGTLAAAAEPADPLTHAPSPLEGRRGEGEGVGALRQLPYLRWAVLAALLLAELLLLTLRHDTAALSGTQVWWADLLGQTHHLLRLVIAVGTALLVFAGAPLRDRLIGLSSDLGRPFLWWPFLLGHLAAFAAFDFFTGHLLGGSGSASLLVLWAATGLATLVLWFAAAVPPACWLSVVRGTGGWLALAAGIGAAAWTATLWTDTLWQPLSRTTFWAARQLLGLLFTEVVCRPEALVLGTASFQVEISAPCSGYESIGLIWVFLGVYLWLFRRSLCFPQAFLLLPLGTAAVWLANVVRIVALIALGSWGWPDVALGGFHSQAGWLAFNAVALGLIAGSRQLRFFTTAGLPTPGGVNPTAAYLVPLLALTAAAMLTRAFSAGFDWLYPLRVLAVAAVLWYYRRVYHSWSWTWSWHAVGLGIVAFVLWLALLPPGSGAATDATIAEGLGGVSTGWAVLWLICRALGSIVTVPLAEELAFRGYLLRRLAAAEFEQVPAGRFAWLPFLLSSILFGMLHESWLAGTLAGMLYALAVYRRGRIADAVVAHAVTNALLAGCALATGAWSLWS